MTPRPIDALLAVALVALTACGTEGAQDAGASPGTTDATIELVAADDAVDLLGDREDVTVIDVRTPEEFDEGHLDGAELFDIQSPDFEERIAALDRHEPYVVYCRTGNRSAVAVELMEELGFTEVYDVGGYAELADAGAPTA
jgi:phage shock protein E